MTTDERYLPGYKKGLLTIGPRLIETRVAFSMYGTPIPLIIGKGSLQSSNIIFSQPLKELSEINNNVKEFSYFATFAVSFGYAVDGISPEKRELLQLSADGKLIVDNVDQTIPLAKNFKYRFYTGTETQKQDPTIARIKGIDRTPAFRGQIYVVIIDLPLAAFDNKIPHITAVIGDKTVAAQVVTDFVSPYDAGNIGNAWVDFDSDRAFNLTTDSTSSSGIHRINNFDISAYAPPSTFLSAPLVNRTGVQGTSGTTKGTSNSVFFVKERNLFFGVPAGGDAIKRAIMFNPIDGSVDSMEKNLVLAEDVVLENVGE